MAKVVKCPECAWSKTAHSEVPEVVFGVEQELKAHLAAEHDWTWQRAHDHARAWSQKLIPGFDPGDSPAGPRGSRTAVCPKCSWSMRAPSEDVFEISHCSAELEEHLKTEHGVAPLEAQRFAEAWASPLLKARPKTRS